MKTVQNRDTPVLRKGFLWTGYTEHRVGDYLQGRFRLLERGLYNLLVVPLGLVEGEPHRWTHFQGGPIKQVCQHKRLLG